MFYFKINRGKSKANYSCALVKDLKSYSVCLGSGTFSAGSLSKHTISSAVCSGKGIVFWISGFLHIFYSFSVCLGSGIFSGETLGGSYSGITVSIPSI